MGQIDDILSGKLKFNIPQEKNEKSEEQGNLSRGFETAMRQVPQTIGGVIGLAGDAIGSDAVKDYGMNIYKNQSQKIQDISKDSDSFTKVLNGDASLGDWAGYGTGYVGGQALQALATGGIGGFVGKKIVQKGLANAVEHEAGSLAAQEAAKQAINKGAKYGAGAALIAGCQSKSVVQTNVCPQLPVKPLRTTPKPAISYSKKWQQQVEKSRKQLMDTKLMQSD